jgi:Transposase IS116/IS110/IS902 family
MYPFHGFVNTGFPERGRSPGVADRSRFDSAPGGILGIGHFRQLMEKRGVGPVTALAFVLTIGPVSRFQRSKQVVSYLGFNPSEESSGGRLRLGSISKQDNSIHY